MASKVTLTYMYLCMHIKEKTQSHHCISLTPLCKKKKKIKDNRGNFLNCAILMAYQKACHIYNIISCLTVECLVHGT